MNKEVEEVLEILRSLCEPDGDIVLELKDGTRIHFVVSPKGREK